MPDIYQNGPCPRCGKPALLGLFSYRCDACEQQQREAGWTQDRKRKAEQNRMAQRRRRQREKIARHLAAGLLVPSKGPGSRLMPVEQILCRHCGEWFSPNRCTALYCCPRCRVAAHRKRADRRAEEEGGR
jgi:hypothetical protein